MNNTNRKIFEYSITVLADHLDELQHVNNVVYVQFMQEAAGKHWNSVVSPEIEERFYGWCEGMKLIT